MAFRRSQLVQRKIEDCKLKVKEQNIPTELKAVDQWVAWKAVVGSGKESKIPINPKTGGNASTSDQTTWEFQRSPLILPQQ